MIEVVTPGALTTVQDAGRPGWAHLGVPRSGALDQPALRDANRLVGNAPDAAGLETTLTGCALRFHMDATVAVCGAVAAVTVAGTARPRETPLPVRASDVLVVAAATAGVRSYIVVRGGIAVPPVLGSRSTDTLSGLGPAPLRRGDLLPIGAALAWEPAPAIRRSRVDGLVPLRISRGPRDDWFDEGAWAVLCGTPYTVSVHSNRVGARLDGPPLARAAAFPGELPSEGIVLGAVQVPADGRPLVFLGDHPTTGGYPVIGVVDDADLPSLAQARPGTTVRFHGSQR